MVSLLLESFCTKFSCKTKTTPFRNTGPAGQDKTSEPQKPATASKELLCQQIAKFHSYQGSGSDATQDASSVTVKNLKYKIGILNVFVFSIRFQYFACAIK